MLKFVSFYINVKKWEVFHYTDSYPVRESGEIDFTINIRLSYSTFQRRLAVPFRIYHIYSIFFIFLHSVNANVTCILFVMGQLSKPFS